MNSIDITKKLNDENDIADYFQIYERCSESQNYTNLYFDINRFLNDSLEDRMDNLIKSFLNIREGKKSVFFNFYKNSLFIGIDKLKNKVQSKDKFIVNGKDLYAFPYSEHELFNIIYNHYKQHKELKIEIVSSNVEKYGITDCDYFIIDYHYFANSEVPGLFVF